jgi:hypothetical protein
MSKKTKIVKYQLLVGDHTEISTEINGVLEEGWELYGSPMYSQKFDNVMQAMVLRKKSEID